MDICRSTDAMRAWRRDAGRTALVPTMGALHQGHLTLVARARDWLDGQGGGRVVTSIFVNPAQFGPNEDLDKYPRQEAQDLDLLRDAGCDAVFLPQASDIWRPGAQTHVQVSQLGGILMGRLRPGHFRGVATVVTKLFNIVQPQAAIFGKKDYQQLMVLRNMARQLALPIDIIGGETVRADDGLALSSRNGYLSPAERAEAPRLSRLLNRIRQTIRAGERDYGKLERAAVAELDSHGWHTDYVAVRQQVDLQAPGEGNPALVVLAASRLGTPRLIDNLEI